MAVEKDVRVGDIVVAIEGKGDRATLIRQDNKIFEKILLTLVHRVENCINRDRKLADRRYSLFLSVGWKCFCPCE